MDANTILFKTGLGIEEVNSKARNLLAKLRMVLIMVDGKASYLELSEKARQLDFFEDSIQQLIDLGYITDGKDMAELTVAATDVDWDKEYCRKLIPMLQNLVSETLGDKGGRVVRKIGATAEDRESILAACVESKNFVRLFIDEAQADELALKFSEAVNRKI